MKPIYLESDEEITSVIDKITNSDEKDIALVAAKNSNFFQSLINLKLIFKESKNLKKNIVLITGNKIGQRLAKEVGLSCYPSLGGVTSRGEIKDDVTPSEKIKENLPEGIVVKQYTPGVGEAGEEVEEPVESAEEADTEQKEPEKIDKVEEEKEEATIDKDTKAEKEDDKKEEKPEKNDDIPAVVSHNSPVLDPKPIKIPWRIVALIGILALITLGVVYAFYPRAKITVSFQATAINESDTLTAQANPSEDAIAANLLSSSLDATKTISSTGKKDIGTKAKGSITITNAYIDGDGAGKDESFSAGAIVTDSKTKLTYVLDSAVSIGKITYNPNNGQKITQSKSVAVTASQPGEAYNLPTSSTFSIAGELGQTTVTNSAAFSGGLTKQITVLSQDDVDKGVNDLKTETKTTVLADLKQKAQNQTIFDQALKEVIKDQKVSNAVGDQVDQTTITFNYTLSTLVFDPDLAKSKIMALMNKKVPDGQELQIPEANTPQYTFKNIDMDKNTLQFDTSLAGFAVPAIDKPKIAKMVAGKSVTNAEEILKNELNAQDIKIEMIPNWWIKRLPLFSQAISVDYGFNETSGT